MGIDYNRRRPTPEGPSPAPTPGAGTTAGLPGSPPSTGISYQRKPSSTVTPAPASSTPAASSGKVTLTKSAPAVSLTKSASATGQVRINLNWDNGGKEKGWFAKPVDLDLACLWEFSDGSKGAVQALGNMFEAPLGSGDPIIRLDGDDRAGTTEGGENLLIDLGQQSRIKRVLIFAFIYEGAPGWKEAKGVATLHPASGPQVEILLDGGETSSRFCAIAMLENTDGDITLKNEMHYVPGGQRALDEEYQWGLQWAAGRK